VQVRDSRRRTAIGYGRPGMAATGGGNETLAFRLAEIRALETIGWRLPAAPFPLTLMAAAGGSPTTSPRARKPMSPMCPV